MTIVSRFLAGSAPTFSAADPRDAPAIAELHGQSFGRGWDEDEVYRLLIDRAVIAHRATSRRSLVGFIMSRLAADEAEILSVAIAPARRGRGLSRPLLDKALPGTVPAITSSDSPVRTLHYSRQIKANQSHLPGIQPKAKQSRNLEET